MTSKLPNNIKNILGHLAAWAAGYDTGLKWNEEEKLKADLVHNRRHWQDVPTDEVRDYCLQLGMSPKDARRIEQLIGEAQAGKRFQPRSYRDHRFDHEALALKQPDEIDHIKSADRHPAAITANGASFPDEAQRQALRWANQQQQSSGGTILAFAPGVQNMKNSRGLIPSLVRERKLKFSTPRTREHMGHRGPIIALWPTEAMLDHLHGVSNPICVVPWTDRAVEAWVIANEPVLLGSDWRTPPRHPQD